MCQATVTVERIGADSAACRLAGAIAVPGRLQHADGAPFCRCTLAVHGHHYGIVARGENAELIAGLSEGARLVVEGEIVPHEWTVNMQPRTAVMVQAERIVLP
jgi:hypothetical protein